MQLLVYSAIIDSPIEIEIVVYRFYQIIENSTKELPC